MKNIYDFLDKNLKKIYGEYDYLIDVELKDPPKIIFDELLVASSEILKKIESFQKNDNLLDFEDFKIPIGKESKDKTSIFSEKLKEKIEINFKKQMFLEVNNSSLLSILLIERIIFEPS